MKITQVNLFPFNTGRIGGRVRAVAEIVLDDLILIRDIKLIESKHGGLFLSFPKKRSGNKFVDIVEILESQQLEQIRRAVVDKYKEMMDVKPEENID
ncbi:MAG TPA: stage V sporulation protein G [Sulfurihydrogenibium sp.]|jgi:stage V sporulation protein G|uniref:septation protein SpoVG family protein n=1 Tax=unclassified Sulfurihydrogenibium TaxID=2619248 RepID=UPI0001724A98|nr:MULTISPECIES: septation protein SpoVG family protein [unclassified Sulfurihydrogenibium]ACD66039.1 putative stage V sporulation protein G [Sulfurihydrogenibium sp. YO3AOP1]HBT98280.1 stage V sporulation protein G [Sulfurihydrogenibium sp.]